MGTMVLLRHGQASFGAEDYDRLSAAGVEQSTAAGAWLATTGPVPDVVLTGGLRRHEETARALMAGAHWSLPVEVDPRWDEFDAFAVVAALPGVEEFDLTDRAQFQSAYLQATARWSSGAHDQDYAEPWPAFVDRVRSAARDAAGRATSGRSVLVVSSGGPIAAVLSAALVPSGVQQGDQANDQSAGPVGRPVLWASLGETMVNTGISRLLVGRRGARVLTVNEHPHLTEPTYR